MKVSSKGLELIKEFEGFSSVAYLCSAKKATIGYGNTFWEDGTPVKIGDQISKERAETLLKHVVDNFSVAVEVDIKIEVSQNQFDAMVSLAYNIGLGAFKNSTLLRQLNRGNFVGASQEFLRWDKSNGKPLLGLTRRREREKLLFDSL
ncbi:lysozyme [Arcobacter cryaerophilus gv. pseudocryaerophilus]|uniref:Lysozyme n=3 Tax=unclassified Arcobacter TaxID=2593671 RepID=A0AA96L0L7_9BACT|nr:lysozyme [Arcobacter sp. AZ-2023]WPD04690.1 lysozyme [Arcobacter sp. DSM 115956]WPD06785.1 lysozyme [Arcobacter sp. DSM 115955]WNL31050.1 lysozyme [Arcobacter sp. AZ-2023]WNP37200.1 lysozyme [Arcobacter sp. AZ-2023]